MSRQAIIVGINEYPTKPLKSCENDANAMYSLLQNNYDDEENFNTELHLNIPTKAELEIIISKLFEKKHETCLFYFSGHGYRASSGTGYLVTPDSSEGDYGISMDEILNYANRSPAKNKIIILDCCNAAALGTHTTLINEGVTILTASRADEAAIHIDGKSYSVFTNLLIEALKGGAADILGNITPGSIYSFVDLSLGELGQRPVFKTNISQFTTLRKAKPSILKEDLKKITDYFEHPDKEFFLNPSYEWTNHKDSEHYHKKPYAIEKHVAIFKVLQQMNRLGLVVPNASDMYFAAMDSKSCYLTPMGKHYWRLVKDKRV